MKELSEELEKYGKVEKCGIFEGKFHVLITDGFSINANNTFSLAKKIIGVVGDEYPIVGKWVTNDNRFDLILERRKK